MTDRMLDAYPRVPAQREAADWWLTEVRADLEKVARRKGAEQRAREIVVEHAGRISPTVLASVGYRLGARALTEDDERLGLRLLGRITEILVAEWRGERRASP